MCNVWCIKNERTVDFCLTAMAQPPFQLFFFLARINNKNIGRTSILGRFATDLYFFQNFWLPFLQSCTVYNTLVPCNHFPICLKKKNQEKKEKNTRVIVYIYICES